MDRDARPSDAPLEGIRILVFVGDDYEDLELWYPKLRLEEAGAHVTVAGAVPGHVYSGKHGYPCASDAAIADMEAADFHGVVIPGGWMPDKLRRDPKVLGLVREFSSSGKLVAAICHGEWMISTGSSRCFCRVSPNVNSGPILSWPPAPNPAVSLPVCSRRSS